MESVSKLVLFNTFLFSKTTTSIRAAFHCLNMSSFDSSKQEINANGSQTVSDDSKIAFCPDANHGRAKRKTARLQSMDTVRVLCRFCSGSVQVLFRPNAGLLIINSNMRRVSQPEIHGRLWQTRQILAGSKQWLALHYLRSGSIRTAERWMD